jgi:hypothetical protein
LRALLGEPVVSEGEEAGELRDLLVAPDGNVEAFVVERDDALHQVAPTGVKIGFVSPA